MGASRSDPPQFDPTDASRELSQHLRFLLDREGLTPRQLAAEDDVPYSPAMLYRFFSGRALPPPQLIEVVARRCGGDPDGLQSAYDRARRDAMGVFAVPQMKARKKRKRATPRPRLLTVGLGVSAAGAVIFATAVNGLAHEQSSAAGAADRAETGQKVAPNPPPAAPDPAALIPESSQRSSTAKQKPKKSPSPTPKPSAPADDGDGAAVPNLITNGTFSGSFAPWQTTPGARLQAEDNELAIVVPPRVNENQPNVAVITSNSFTLQAGRSYVLRFEASANESVSLVAIVQNQGPPPANVLVQPSPLNGSAQTYSYSFAAPTAGAAPAIVAFQVAAAGERYTIKLDNVSVTPA